MAITKNAPLTDYLTPVQETDYMTPTRYVRACLQVVNLHAAPFTDATDAYAPSGVTNTCP